MQSHSKVSRTFNMALIFCFIFGFFAVFQAPTANAQGRVNDKDMKALMRNLRQDATSFRPEFDRAVRTSTIRKTSQEKDARRQVADFVLQTENLQHRFKKDHNGQAEFSTVMASAEQIDRTVHSLALGSEVTEKWHRIRTELRQLGDAYGMPAQFGDNDRDMGGSR